MFKKIQATIKLLLSRWADIIFVVLFISAGVLPCTPLGDAATASMDKVMAVGLAYIAFKQWQTSERERRQNYWEHYSFVYNTLVDAISNVIEEGTPTKEGLSKAWQAYDRARLFLHTDVSDYAKEIHRKALRLWIIGRKLEHLPVGEKRNKLADEDSEICKWFGELAPSEIFRPYLSDY